MMPLCEMLASSAVRARPKSRGDGLVAGAGEVVELDNAGRERILGGQQAQGVVQRQQAVVRIAGRDIGEIDPHPPAAVFRAFLAAGGVDEDAPHGLRRGGEEVAAMVPPRDVPGAGESEVRLVHESRGLQGVPRLLLGHACGGEFAQLVVEEREQVGGRLAVTGRRGVQESRHLGHSASVTLPAGSGMEKWLQHCPFTRHRTLTLQPMAMGRAS
jgi:hypothetical protein